MIPTARYSEPIPSSPGIRPFSASCAGGLIRSVSYTNPAKMIPNSAVIATTTHMRIGAEERAKLGIGDGTVRISVGLEDADDIIGDLVQALG